MKRMFMGLLGLILLICFAPCSIAGEKLKVWPKVKNGGFEQVEQGKLRYWTVSGQIDALSLDENIHKKGNLSARIDFPKYSKVGLRLQLAVEVEAFKRFDFGGDIKTESLDDGYAQLYVQFFDKDGVDVGKVEFPKISGTQGWGSPHMWVETPAGADTAHITCFTKGKGKAWFDNIRFTTKLQGGY